MDKRKLIYSILKEIEQGNEPRAVDYGIELEEFGTVVEMIQRQGLITGAMVQRAGIGSKVVYAFLDRAKIEIPGLDYLEENSSWSKLYKGLKEVRDWIKP
ncbi:hypothetical protein MTP04_22550 [Lysinibacillus sp. PLM2]|nr:hypothetical protein MTP04_22550 [Lysinibacillus sp. PLM2]